jgi:parallel beta-helix repeat protein
MVQSAPFQVLYVNPATGNDAAVGTGAEPLKTLTQAIQRAAPGTEIKLAAGTYNAEGGEVFPLVIPTGVTVRGNETEYGEDVVIEGSGQINSTAFGQQAIALQLEGNAQLRGVTVTNPVQRGTGVWVESSQPTIANNRFLNCGREGIFLTGTAVPEITDNFFRRNAASGISVTRLSRGEIRQNRFRNTGYGIALSDQSAPLIVDNDVQENRAGIVVIRSARPVLRGNRLENNRETGLLVRDVALPDLGDRQSPGENILRDNGNMDLQNDTRATLVSAGNWLNPVRVRGDVEFVAIQVRQPVALPVVEPEPTPVPVPVPEPTPAPVPVPPPPVSPPEVTVNLSDIEGHWAEDFIKGLVSRRIISGFPDGSFRPEVKMTRSQFAAILARAFDQPQDLPNRGFTDVPASFWAAGAIAKVERMGFMAGFPDKTFRPNQPLTRVQAIVALVKGLKLTGGNPNSLMVYRDRAEIPSYAAEPVATATQRQMVVNFPLVDQLRPLVDITRGEVAALVYQAMVARLQAPPVSSPYIVTPDSTIPSFSDIRDHWAEAFIRGLAVRDIITGFVDGSFRPEQPMNRAQYAALLSHTFNLPIKRPKPNFKDIDASFWATPAIDRAYQTGLLSGYQDRTFRPNQPVLRLEVLLSLVNGLGLPEADLESVELFEDWRQVPAFARDEVAKAVQQRLVVSYPKWRRLRPLVPASRGDVAALVYQTLVYQGRTPPIQSPYIADPSASPAPTPPAPSPSPTPVRGTVVIDPGHGGEDPGAIGIGGIREKDIVLAIGLETAAALQRRGLKAILTRSDDRYVDLPPRVQLAEREQADVFVSIHANSAGLSLPQVNGLETYHYPGSRTGARLARAVQNQILQSLNPEDRGVREANFFVLRTTSMPAILVETGFLTGREDAANLSSASYRRRLADAIATGVLTYIQQG